MVAQAAGRAARPTLDPLAFAEPAGARRRRRRATGDRGASVRTPSFCSGCPHNRSTQLPEGSRALAGIGCHGMAMFLRPGQHARPSSHMGGEGMIWLGQQPFTDEKHVFANLGDGTYAHSGSLAIRQAVAAQRADHLQAAGQRLRVDDRRPADRRRADAGADGRRARAPKACRRSSSSPTTRRSTRAVKLPAGVPVQHRSRAGAPCSSELREYPGVSVIVYEQPCATERRRLRKRGKWEDPAKRTLHQQRGLRRLRRLRQGRPTACRSSRWRPSSAASGASTSRRATRTFSCVEGFCPSFVTVHGGRLRKPDKTLGGRTLDAASSVPEPAMPASPAQAPFNVLVGGIGGTGVVTIGQVLGVAAHLDGTHARVAGRDGPGAEVRRGAVAPALRARSRRS